MGDDFEVFAPDDWFQTYTFEPQSGNENVADSHDTEEPSKPEHDNATALGPTIQDTSYLNLAFMGESVPSFRCLLKRYNLWRRESPRATGSTESYNVLRRSAYPFLRGALPNAVDTRPSGSYNIVNTVLLHWISNAYAGWRGSIRYKIMHHGAVEVNKGMVYVQRMPIGNYSNVKFTFGGYTTNDDAASSAIIDKTGNPLDAVTGPNGAAYANMAVNPNIEFEMPYYSPYRFMPGRKLSHTTANEYCESYMMTYTGAANDFNFMDFHVAAGEDFQTYFWLGLPPVKWNITL